MSHISSAGRLTDLLPLVLPVRLDYWQAERCGPDDWSHTFGI